jgi:hypothetical protein
MPNATSTLPGGVSLDWRRVAIGDLAPCVVCAESWIATHAANAANQARLIRAHSPRGGGRR